MGIDRYQYRVAPSQTWTNPTVGSGEDCVTGEIGRDYHRTGGRPSLDDSGTCRGFR